MILGALLFAASALAATSVSLFPATIETAPGQAFTVSISINPQGIPNFAEKIEMAYPAETFEATAFTLASNWIALSQPGYDATDNVKGVLVKTAGYPSGFTASTPFGTVSFRAKKAGSGTIAIGSNSLAFEANRESAMTGNSVAVTVNAPTAAPAVVPAKAPTTVTPQGAPAPKAVSPSKTGPTTDTAPEQAGGEVDTATQGAAVTTASETGEIPRKWIVIGLIVLALVGYGAYVLGTSRRA